MDNNFENTPDILEKTDSDNQNKQSSQNQTYTYQYDKRGNRIAETGKKESRAFTYDETNHLVEGTNWKSDKSAHNYLSSSS